ncbi:MAG: hypothetical protein IJ982_09210 [Fibrobacter sp.]|nr:hypothetical protein [Fibrobacter sp.]
MGNTEIREWTGKIKEKRTVAYRIRLPRLELSHFSACEAFLEEIRDAFLLFLAEESTREGEVMFGGIDFHFEKKNLILSYAFSPFGRRQFVPAVWIELDEEGSIRTLSRKINARPTREDRATDSPEAKGGTVELDVPDSLAGAAFPGTVRDSAQALLPAFLDGEKVVFRRSAQ